MSGNSYGTSCPNCGQDMDVLEDSRPFPLICCSCCNCGFFSTIKTGYYTLGELNDMRRDSELKPLTKKKYASIKKGIF